jgi:predicted transposase YdaD
LLRLTHLTWEVWCGSILHLEFQTRWSSKPPIPFRMLEYWTRLYRIYGLPIVQVVVVLTPPTDETVIEEFFRSGTTYHEFSVVKMWEEPTELFLNDPVLLPFATLTQTGSADRLLNQVAYQVENLPEPDQRRQISSYVQLMAGLKYDKDIVHRLFSEGIMRESVIYQEIFQAGEAQGEVRGERQMAVRMVVRHLARTLGQLSPALLSRLDRLSLVQIEALSEALFDFTSLSDLIQWLSAHEN